VSQLLDLALAQPADRPGQEPGDLGAEGGCDLRRTGEQEVTGEDRLQVAPLGVHRLDSTASVGLVDHVVVVQRSDLHQLHRGGTHDHVLRHRTRLGRRD
jgi:hypothetical protein